MLSRPPIVRSRMDGRVVHPGLILLEQFMRPFWISQNALARRIGVPPRRINEIVNGKRSITADTAIGLGDAIGPSAHFWMAMQADYDIEMAWEARKNAPPRRMEPFRAIGIAVPMLGPDGREVETGYDEGRYDRFEVVRQKGPRL